MKNDEKQTLFRDMQTHPDKYSDQELESMMADIDRPADASQAWQRFAHRHPDDQASFKPRRWPMFRAVAALFILVVLFAAGAFFFRDDAPTTQAVQPLRVRGTKSPASADSLWALCVVNGEKSFLSDSSLADLEPYLYRHHLTVTDIHIFKDEHKKAEYAQQFGVEASKLSGVIDVVAEPDTFCTAYVDQHPELKTSRHYVEGTVVDAEGQPLPEAWVRVSGQIPGIAADSAGHFALWLPASQWRLDILKSGYKSVTLTDVSDSLLRIQLVPAPPKRNDKSTIRIRGVEKEESDFKK